MENNNIFIKIVTFTKTNDITLPYDELYSDDTGHEMECIGNYKEGEGSYNNLHSKKLFDIYCDKLYTKTINYEQVSPIIKEVNYVFIKSKEAPDENDYQHTGLYKYIEYNFYQLVIGLYKKEEGKYKYIQNSYCNKKENEYFILDIKINQFDNILFS